MSGVYVPSPWGHAYHNRKVDEILGGGSAGPGKTEVLLHDADAQIFTEHKRCEFAMDHPYPLKWGQSVGWAIHFRRTYPQVLQTIERSHRIFPLMDPKARWYGDDKMWEFSSGYKFQFGSLNDPDSWSNFYSSEYTHEGWDELVQFEEEQYMQVRTRLRTTDPVLIKMLRCASMSNPLVRQQKNENFTVSNPNWVRDYFVEPARGGNTVLKRKVVLDSGEEVWRTRLYMPARLTDNPNAEFRRQYEIELQSQKPHIRLALLRGDWYVTPGSFYSDVWDPRLHVCSPFRIPDDWPRFRSMDWGYKNPGRVYWWAMDPEDNLFCYRELTFQEKTDVQVAMMILEIDMSMGYVKGGRSLLTGPADTQLWEERGESARTKAQVMASKGVYWTKANKLSRKHNAERLVARLKDHHMGKATPGIVFFNTCHKMLETLPTIQTDPHDIECPADGGDDHSHDNVLYACAYASRGRIGMPKVDVRSDWERDDDDDRRDHVKDNRGKLGYGV